MSRWAIHLLLLSAVAMKISCHEQDGVKREAVRMAHEGVAQARNWAWVTLGLDDVAYQQEAHGGVALRDCVQLYGDSGRRLRRLLAQAQHEQDDDNARTWLSGALASHRTCVDGLRERNFFIPHGYGAGNLSVLLGNALALYTSPRTPSNGSDRHNRPQKTQEEVNQGLLASWNASTWRADFVVAKDGSGSYRTIKEALAALSKAAAGNKRPSRVVVYVKSGVYVENVEIDMNMKNVMLVGDGIDKTIVTGCRNVQDGSTTFRSATFGVTGDGFWARDMTFENTAGPAKRQAVAVRVGSDLSVFYRCSFKSYQDTLLVHSQRQFYRDCLVYGTIDFIFGNAATVLQNCNIYVRRPMGHQSNMITAQGRDDPNENTGICIHSSRIAPAQDFASVKYSFNSYLGRPWMKFSRTVILKTDLDGFIHPKGWAKSRGDFGLSTLYYAEFMNTGAGASTRKRVNWPGFHVLNDLGDASSFTVGRFIQGESWIPETGVPFSTGL